MAQNTSITIDFGKVTKTLILPDSYPHKLLHKVFVIHHKNQQFIGICKHLEPTSKECNARIEKIYYPSFWFVFLLYKIKHLKAKAKHFHASSLKFEEQKAYYQDLTTQTQAKSQLTPLCKSDYLHLLHMIYKYEKKMHIALIKEELCLSQIEVLMLHMQNYTCYDQPLKEYSNQ